MYSSAFILAAVVALCTAVLSADTRIQQRDANAAQKETVRAKRSDDLSTTELRNLVEQQAQVIQTLQGQVEALKQSVQSHQTDVDNRFQALEGRLPASFKQVAFTARFSADDGQNGIHLNPKQVLQFDVAVTNIGNGYNSNTGIFTAPVSGTYVFFLTQMGTDAHGHLHLDIVKQATTVLDQVFTPGSEDVNDQGSGLVATHLTAGEQVWVRQAYGDAVRGSYWTVFSGFLVQAD